MSGRPASPSYTIRTFAPDANYPAGANDWNGQATKVEPAGAGSTGFTPDTGASAEEVNKLVNDLCAQDANAKTYFSTLLSWMGQLPALNFRLGATDVFNGGVFSPVERRWYFCGAAKVIKYSTNLGASVSSNVITALAGTADVMRMAVDGSGNLVATAVDGQVYEYNKGSTTWTRRDVTASISASEAYEIVYDATNAKWIFNGVSVGGNTFARYSPDRVTWTAPATYPAIQTNNNEHSALAVNATGVACFVCNVAGTLRVQTSSDGGVNWTAQTSITIGFTPNKVSLTYEPESNLFVLSIGWDNTETKVYTSSDGITFTQVFHLATGVSFDRVKCLGELWVAQKTNGALAYSLDRGVSWTYANFATGTPNNLLVGAGGFLALDSIAGVWTGLRCGSGEGLAVT